MSTKHDGGPAFPHKSQVQSGMTLRDWFAGQALANPAICTGSAQIWELKAWFGGEAGVTRGQIVAAQAHEYADAMLKERDK